MKLLLINFLIISSSFGCFSQENSTAKRYIKIVIDHDVTTERETSISESFAHIPGIQVSRMDNLNRTYLAIYSPGDALNKETFTTWFENQGYTVSCFYDGEYVVGKMIDLSKNNCH